LNYPYLYNAGNGGRSGNDSVEIEIAEAEEEPDAGVGESSLGVDGDVEIIDVVEAEEVIEAGEVVEASGLEAT